MADLKKYEEVLRLIENGDISRKTCEKMEEFIKEVENSYKETETEVYFSFNHIMELYIYSYYIRPEKEIKLTELKMHEFYRVYAYILAGLKEYDKALEAVDTSLKWNVVDIDTWFEKCEILRGMGKLDEFIKVTGEAHRYAFSRATLARIYRNYGYYYVENLKGELASMLYRYSNIYFHTDNADNELKFIKEATGNEPNQMSVKEMQKMLGENNIPLGPDADTIGIIFRVGQILLGDGDVEPAKDCFSIVYDVTQDEEVGQVLIELSKNKPE